MKAKTKKLFSLAMAVLTSATIAHPIQANAATEIKGCKGVPVEIHAASVSGTPITFTCSDNCGFRSEKVGNSSVSIGNFTSSADIYNLTFEVPGIHVITGTDATGMVVVTQTYEIADGHNYGMPIEWQKVTCTTDGKREYTCLNCRDKKEEIIPAIGHNFSEWILSTQPTSIAKGKERRECANCGKKEYKSVDKLEAFVNLSEEDVELKIGKSASLRVDEFAKGDYVLKWKNSNPKVASFKRNGSNACTIKAKKSGKTKITVVMRSGCKATCVVNVK